MGMYRDEVTEEEFVQEMLRAYPNEYSEHGLKCLYGYLVDEDENTVFEVESIHREFSEYKGLGDYNERNNATAESISDIWGALEFANLDGFIVG